MAEPPAKKARLDGDSLDVPSSPVDDFDDDFYETPQLDNAPNAQLETVITSSSTSAAQPENAAPSLIPGLSSWTAPPPTNANPVPQALSLGSEADEEVEDGEISDTDVFYGGDKSEAQASVTATEDALQHNKNDAPDNTAPTMPPVATAATNAQPTPAIKTNTSAHTDGIPVSSESNAIDEAKVEFLQAAEANKDNDQAEWQLDSEASDSSDSSSDDSSSDSDSDSEGELLTTEEAIKRMLAEDPEDGEASAPKAKVKTQNEIDEQYQKPSVTVTEAMEITELGHVENIVDNVILIKANVSGDYHVLESGSVVCLANRTVIGQISETIGRVQDPRYSVGFATAEEIATSEITQGTRIYYVNDHSSFVYTEPLRVEKHTDASGQYDEETNVKEFSDDEEEAMFKREVREKKKDLKRKANGDDHDDPQSAAYTNLPYGNETANSQEKAAPSGYQNAPLKYSDDEDEDLGMYRPLARPDRFEDIVGAGAPLEDRSHVRRGGMRGRAGWVDRGRGFRGRGAMGGGRGDRFDRGGVHNGGGRGDRGGGNHGGGRGDRGGQTNRGRGDRSNRGQNDRHGRHQQQERQMSGPPQDNRQGSRGAFSPSPARQNQGRHQQPPHSSPRGKKNRKRHHRGTPERSSQPPAATAATGSSTRNTNAYSTNNTQSGADWSASYSTAIPAGYTTSATSLPAPAAAYGSNPAYYPQQAQTAAQAQANMAQWIQLAAVLQQAQAQQQMVQPPPQAPQQQAQAQYPPYAYQYQQALAQSANPGQANHQAGGNTPSLQDILRALGNGSGN